MRALLLGLLLAGATLAQGPLSPEQEQELARVIGPDWPELPEWRREMIRKRYGHFLNAPGERRERILGRGEEGLREFLVRPERRNRLPEPIREELERLPEGDRGAAAKLAVMRLLQRRLDRHLGLVPFERRRELFRSLFPEPFDRAAAGAARKELEAHVAKAMAARVRERLGDRPREDFRAVLREVTEQEEHQLVASVRDEMARFREGSLEGFRLLEGMQLSATPRQRELIRYAMRPHECPLLRRDFMGPVPEDPAQRRLWERDFTVIARLDLLTEAALPHEMVLHLASAGSPEDLFRALVALRGKRKSR